MPHKTGMSALTLQTIGTRTSKWGEGPIWWQDQLIYVDIEAHTLIRLDPETGTEQTWNVGERIGTVVPRASGVRRRRAGSHAPQARAGRGSVERRRAQRSILTVRAAPLHRTRTIRIVYR